MSKEYIPNLIRFLENELKNEVSVDSLLEPRSGLKNKILGTYSINIPDLDLLNGSRFNYEVRRLTDRKIVNAIVNLPLNIFNSYIESGRMVFQKVPMPVKDFFSDKVEYMDVPIGNWYLDGEAFTMAEEGEKVLNIHLNYDSKEGGRIDELKDIIPFP